MTGWIPVTVTCRVLKLARQPYYRWLADPVTDREWHQAHLANALFDAHRDDPEFGYRLLGDEARDAGAIAGDRVPRRSCAPAQPAPPIGLDDRRPGPLGRARGPGPPTGSPSSSRRANLVGSG